MSIAVAARVWAALYEPSYGPANSFLKLLGPDALTRVWLGDPDVALPTIIVARAWHLFGCQLIFYLAGLQGINRELYDAAYVDGADQIRVLWFVPSLIHVHTTVLSLAIIASLRPFSVMWAITEGGPFYATEVLPSLLYKQGLVQFHLGYGSKTGVVLALLMFVITLLFMRLRGAWEGVS